MPEICIIGDEKCILDYFHFFFYPEVTVNYSKCYVKYRRRCRRRRFTYVYSVVRLLLANAHANGSLTKQKKWPRIAMRR